MKILSAEQIRKADQYTIEHEPIKSIDLMERAARACFEWINSNLPDATNIAVYCGVGNNGGDGLAIARMLAESGKSVEVYLLTGSKPSDDFLENMVRLKETSTKIFGLKDGDHHPNNSESDLIIDAIFGTGLQRKPGLWQSSLISHLNNSGKRIVAIDLPSGLKADEPSEGDIIKAQYTLTFQQPKLSFFLPEYGEFTGKWICLNIGLSQDFIADQSTDYYLTDSDYIKSHLKVRTTFTHKGSFGHALIVAGSHGKYGAAILAARACIRAGAGLTTVHIPSEAANLLHQSCPEAMVASDLNADFIGSIGSTEKYSTIGIGPGLGTRSETADALLELLRKTEKPMVIDADALNIISENPTFLDFVPKKSILTPHPKEFSRLAGESENGFERLKKQIDFAVKHQFVVVLKGAFTSIAMPDGRVCFNPTGNPGLAKGGSGDVLTGICTGFLAQQYAPEEAAILSVYLHGLSADQLLSTRSDFSIIAGDLIDNFGKVLV